MAFDQNMIIDATRGSMARFVNHSCAPNCRMEKWTVSGKPRMALFAGDRGIMTAEELTYDYNFDPYSQKNVQVCRCGAENCRGVLGPKPKDLPKLKEEREGKLAGAKRKIAEVLEESTNLLNMNVSMNMSKKRKVDGDEPPKLPKGWAYVEPEVKVKVKKEAKVKSSVGEDDGLIRQPSKLRRMLSHKSNKSVKSSVSVKRKSGGRIVSTSSVAALITGDERDNAEGEVERPATGLSSTAEGLRRLGRSLRGRV